MIRVHLTGLTHPKTIRISFKRKPKMELVPKIAVYETSEIGWREARWTSFEVWVFDVYSLSGGGRIRIGTWHPARRIPVDSPHAPAYELKRMGKQAARMYSGRLT